MELKEREEIFAKEILTIKDLQNLYAPISYCRAAQFMRELKFHGDRIKMRGKIHFEDYKQALQLKTRRYYEYYDMPDVQLPDNVVAFTDFLNQNKIGV